MTADFFTLLLKLGYAGENDPIVGGALIFVVAGLGIGYLAFVREEMDAGPVLKIGSVLLLSLAILAYFWPYRPWPH